jgi:hypothetical protein
MDRIKIALDALTAAQYPLELYSRYGWTDRAGVRAQVDAAIAALQEPLWMPIESAPKDGTVILGLCRHDADPYYVGDRLTDYGARCEGLGHVADGIHAICWEAAREESDGWEQPSYWIPAGWIHNADHEQMANPTHWIPLPTPPKD